MKKLYTAEVTCTNGRTGTVKSADGKLNLQLAMPKELGGAGGEGSNPELLFAAGFAACFNSAVLHVSKMKKIPLTDCTVTAHVDIGALPTGAFGLATTLDIQTKGLDQKSAEELVAMAHQICPYSNATRNNMEVQLNVTAIS